MEPHDTTSFISPSSNGRRNGNGWERALFATVLGLVGLGGGGITFSNRQLAEEVRSMRTEIDSLKVDLAPIRAAGVDSRLRRLEEGEGRGSVMLEELGRRTSVLESESKKAGAK